MSISALSGKRADPVCSLNKIADYSTRDATATLLQFDFLFAIRFGSGQTGCYGLFVVLVS